MMRKFAYSLAAMVVLSVVALANSADTTITGVLMDNACSARHLKAANPQESAAGDSKGCALKDGCAKSGFGVFADGKFTKFDEKGNTLAKAALEKTKKDKGATFKVIGTVDKGVMAVKSIEEVL